MPAGVKSWDFTTFYSIWRSQTLAWKLYLQLNLLAEQFVFWGWWSGFTKRGCTDLLHLIMPPMSSLNSSIFFLSSHIYSLMHIWAASRPQKNGVLMWPKDIDLAIDIDIAHETWKSYRFSYQRLNFFGYRYRNRRCIKLYRLTILKTALLLTC
jgi:hypothetical protein